jgi:predicted transcriptional regulator
MPKKVERYLFDDLKNPENNCIVSTMVQLSDKCGIPYSTLQKIFTETDIHYDRGGKFKIEKRDHYIATSKSRIK